MRLQETGNKRARLYVPAELRDALGLTDFERVGIRLTCRNDRLVALINPIKDDEETNGAVRSLTIKTNGQVQLDFPRQVAVTAGFLSTELTLDRDNDHLILSPKK